MFNERRHRPRDVAPAARSDRPARTPAAPVARLAAQFGLGPADYRLRTDATAAQRAAAAGARAYTDGREIGFARGAFAPHTVAGQRTLAHELAHVAQARGGTVAAPPAPDVPTAELQARQAASVALAGGRPAVTRFAPQAPLYETPTPKTTVPSSYHFASVQIKAWLEQGKNVGFQVYRHHLRMLYPATEQDVIDCLGRFKSWGLEGNVQDALAKAKGGPIRIDIKPEFHNVIRDWIKEKTQVDVGALGAAQSGAGGQDEGSSTGDGTGTGSGTGSATGSGTGTDVPAANLEEAADKVQAELQAKAAAASRPPVKTKDSDGKERFWPAEFSDPAQREKLLALMKEIVGEAPKLEKDEASKVNARLSAEEARFLMQIALAEAAQKDKIVAKLKGEGELKPANGMTLAQTLETAIEVVEIEEHADELGVTLEKGPPSTDPSKIPIENRPVRGLLKNEADALSPNERAVWKLVVREDRDALRVPHIYTWWKAVRLADDRKSEVEVVSSENTHHMPVNGQNWVTNDSEFDFTVRTPGPHRVKAIVHHNFFKPAYFQEDFDVEEEKEQSDRQFEASHAGLIDPKNTQGWDVQFYEQGQAFDYRQGWKRYGRFAGTPQALTPEALAADLRKQRDAIKTQVEDEIAKHPDNAESLREGLNKRLEQINEQISKIETEKGTHPLVVSGQFSSRVRGIEDTPLTLACTLSEVKKDKEGGGQVTHFQLYLHDATARGSKQVYHLAAEADSVEAAQKSLFEQLADAYPFGTLNVVFQKYSLATHAPTREFVQFKKVTDSSTKDVKSVVFSDAVDTAVNVVGTVLSLIPLTTTVGVTMLVVYNTAKATSDNLDDLATGNFRREKGAVVLADLALNLLPLAPKVVKVGKIGYWAIRGASVGGSLLLMSVSGLQQVSELRRDYVDLLAAKKARYDQLMQNNKAHPEIVSGSLLREIEQLRKDTESAMTTVFTQMGTQALFLHAVSTGVDMGTKALGPSPIETRLLPDLEARRKSIGTLKEQGAFVHEPGGTPRYDYSKGQIVADEGHVKPAEYNALAREANADRALNGAGVAAGERAKIGKELAALDLEIKPGIATEVVTPPGGKPQLRVKPGATAADIGAALKAAPKEQTPGKAALPKGFAPPPEQPLPGSRNEALSRAVNDRLSARAKGNFERIEVEILPESGLGPSKKTGKIVIEGKRAKVQFVGEPPPGALAEEIAHLEQLADPRFAPQVKALEAARKYEWSSLPDKDRLAAHKARLELEADAQRKVIDALGRKDKPTEAEVLAVDNAYQNLEQLRGKLAHVNGLESELAATGRLAQRPALLDVEPTLTAKRTTNAYPLPKDWKSMNQKEFIKAYREAYPDTSLTNAELADRHRNGARLNPDTLRMKDPTLVDNPVPDVRAKVEAKEAIDIGDLKLSAADKKKIDALLAERDKAIAARDKANDAGRVEEAGQWGAKVNEASRQLGETHAEAYMRDKYPGFAREYPKDPTKPSRAGDFDQVWVRRKAGLGGKIVVEVVIIEAKGGASRLGARKYDGLLVEQGSGAYFKSIVQNMAENGTDEMRKLALLVARTDPKNIVYKVVRAPVEKSPAGSVVLKVEVGDFDMKSTQLPK
jgi:hypothetical protein